MVFPIVFQAPAQGGLDTPITYSQSAKLVGAVLAELSKEAKITLKANSEASKEVVLISVNALPLKGLMDKIAFVTSCSWKQMGDGYTLEPSQSIRNREESEELANRALKTKKLVEAKVAHLTEAESKAAAKAKAADANKDKPAKKTDDGDSDGDEESDSDEGFGAGMFGFGSGGDDKAITQLLSMVDPGQLAQVEGGSRLVWATNNATQMQIPINGDCGPVVQNWIAAHNESVPKDAASAMPDDANQPGMPKALMDMMKAKMARVTEPVSKAIMVADRTPFMGTVQITLKAYSNDGKVLLSGQTQLDSTALEALKKMAEGKAAPPAASSGASTPIEFSPASKELEGGTASMMGSSRSKLSPNLRAQLLHPEINDPLGFMATDMYLAVAKKKHRQLVADLPDEAYGRGEGIGMTEPAKTVEEVEASISSREVVQASDDGEFLYLRPAKPAEDRIHRTDRTALRTLLHAVEAKGLPSLDDIADFSLSSDDPMSSGMLMTYFALFSTGIGSGVMMNGGQTGWSLYRVYGSLDGTERQTLRSGGSVPFAAMNGAQQGYCAAYLFSSESSIEAEGANQSHDFFTRMMSRFMGGGADYKDEPTEVMPNGLPVGGSLSCTPNPEPMIQTGDGDGALSNWTLGPEELAMFRMFSKSAPQAEGAFKLPKQGLLGTRLKLDLTFHVGPKLSAQGELSDSYVDKNGSLVSLASLPGEFESRIQAELQALQKSPMGSIASMMPPKEVIPPR
jgi:hypothetical protein